MKRLLLSTLLIAGFLSVNICFSQEAEKSDTLRILCIGNSFSVDAVEQNLSEIAREDGNCAIIGNLYVSGCTLSMHYRYMQRGNGAYSYRKIDKEGVRTVKNKVSLAKALADEKWDVVTLQQASPYAGKIESYEPYITKLKEYVARKCPQAKIMFHQTWAYAKYCPNINYATYGNDQAQMYSRTVEAGRAVCERHGFEVIPNGTAIQNVRGTIVGENVIRDGYHLNLGIGCYTAACTFYAAVFGRTVTGNAHRAPHMTDEQVRIAQNAADSAVAKPFDLSVIAYDRLTSNTHEAFLGEISLPDPLLALDGSRITTSEEWTGTRRPELLELFSTQMYGRMPEEVGHFEPVVLETKTDAFDSLATRKRVAIYLDKNHRVWIDLMVYTPNSGAPSPLFLGLNFGGNDSCTTETDVTTATVKESQRYGVYRHAAPGSDASSWQIEELLRHGYGVATFYHGDVEPDIDDTNVLGVQSLYPRGEDKVCDPDEWGSVAAWAWGLSRAMDYLETDADVDAGRVAVIGHSRLGKAALWAGACDERFAMVIANESGCGGASLSSRNFGETITQIQQRFPHWFCDNFKRYTPDNLPFDQHEVISLCAPRIVCIGSAEEDHNSDPKGERLAAESAAKVYDLFGEGMSGRIHYHIRPGKHGITPADWQEYLKVAEEEL